MHVDVIVIGLGAMGSAAAYELSRRGMRVLGLERFARGHALGSSGGRSRLIRLAYFEHPDYVPLLREAWRMWRELERVTSRQLLIETGAIYAGPAGSSLLDGSRRSAEAHDLPHRVMDAVEAARAFPALRLRPDMHAVHETSAGALLPDQCLEAHMSLAVAGGADLRFGERVLRWTGGPVITVDTDRDRYTCDRLVLSAGAWMAGLAGDVLPPLRVERCPVLWFDPVGPTELLVPGRLPIYMVDTDGGLFYGFPVLADHGLKAARHHTGEVVDPDQVDRDVHAADEAPVRQFLDRHLPAAAGARRDGMVCLYTTTPDEHFIIDHHPADRRVVICSPCSGHGFKFAPVVGAIVADLALDGGTAHPIEFLSLRRFSAEAAPGGGAVSQPRPAA